MINVDTQIKPFKLVYYSDPGHGWVRVPRRLILELGIENEISSFSYMNSKFIYLEEDSDASIFAEALIAQGSDWDAWRDLMSDKYSERTKIRAMDNYEHLTANQLESLEAIKQELREKYPNKKSSRIINKMRISQLVRSIENENLTSTYND